MWWTSVIFSVVISIQFSYCENDGKYKENKQSSIAGAVSPLTATGVLNKDDNLCVDVYKYPIDLPADAPVATYGNITFTGFELLYKTKLVIANGNLEYYLTDSEQVMVSEGGLEGVYYVHKIRFIYPSRHIVPDAGHIAEANIICVNTKYNNYETASEHPDGLAIFVTFAKIGTGEHPAYKQYLDALKHVQGDPPSYELPTKFSPSSALPENRCSFFRYRGRYSPSSCKENATWTIFTDSVEIIEKQQSDTVERFKVLQDKFGIGVTKDAEYLPSIDMDIYKLTRKRMVTLQPKSFCNSPVS